MLVEAMICGQIYAGLTALQGIFRGIRAITCLRTIAILSGIAGALFAANSALALATKYRSSIDVFFPVPWFLFDIVSPAVFFSLEIIIGTAMVIGAVLFWKQHEGGRRALEVIYSLAILNWVVLTIEWLLVALSDPKVVETEIFGRTVVFSRYSIGHFTVIALTGTFSFTILCAPYLAILIFLRSDLLKNHLSEPDLHGIQTTSPVSSPEAM